MRHIRTRRTAWATVPVAAVLLLAGCGGDDDDDSEGASSTPPAASAPAGSAPAGAVDPATFSADQKAAAEAYKTAFTGGTPIADRKAVIQDSAKLNTMLDAMLGNALVSTVSVRTNNVVINGDSGTVNYEILLNGQPAGLPAEDGPVVKQDGVWKVGAKTVCAFATLAQVQAAPECASY